MQDLNGLKPERLDAVEDPLAGAEQDRRDVERELGLGGALVAEMPAMELTPTLTEWILAALVGPGDETVERDRHVAGGVRHRRPRVSLRLASGDSTPGTAAKPPHYDAAWACDA